MGKVTIVYESKYGNTQRAAEAIAEGIREAADMQVTLLAVKEVNLEQPADFDVLLIGSPNHFGRQTMGIRKFIDKLGKLDLEGKHGAVFDTYIFKDYEKAVKKMEKQISDQIPGLKLLTPGLSVRVKEAKGPVQASELNKCKAFGRKIAKQITA